MTTVYDKNLPVFDINNLLVAVAAFLNTESNFD